MKQPQTIVAVSGRRRRRLCASLGSGWPTHRCTVSRGRIAFDDGHGHSVLLPLPPMGLELLSKWVPSSFCRMYVGQPRERAFGVRWQLGMLAWPLLFAALLYSAPLASRRLKKYAIVPTLNPRFARPPQIMNKSFMRNPGSSSNAGSVTSSFQRRQDAGDRFFSLAILDERFSQRNTQRLTVSWVVALLCNVCEEGAWARILTSATSINTSASATQY